MNKQAVTVGELISINNALYFLVNKVTNGMDIYKINLLIGGLKKEAIAYEDTRKKINNKHLKKGQTKFEEGSPEALKAFNELKKVRDQKADDFEYNKLPLDILNRVSFKENEGSVLIDIMFLFKEPEKG